MKIDVTVNVYHRNDPDVVRSLQTLLRAADQLLKGQKTIMATNQEALDKLDAIGATLDTVSAETTALVEEVRALKEAAENQNVSDELMAKINSLADKAISIDEKVDSVAPNPTETPAEG